MVFLAQVDDIFPNLSGGKNVFSPELLQGDGFSSWRCAADDTTGAANVGEPPRGVVQHLGMVR
jgi:hypothetical protein